MKEELAKYRINDAREKILSSEILLKSKQYKDVTVQLLEATDELSLRATEGSEAISEIASSLPLLAMTRLLPEAELLHKDSVSRSYYAMFSAARALLATKGYDSAKHSGVIALFNQHFVKKGLVSSEMGRLLAEAKDVRERGDYADFIEVSEEEAGRYLDAARRFIEEIDRALKQ